MIKIFIAVLSWSIQEEEEEETGLKILSFRVIGNERCCPDFFSKGQIVLY